MNKAHKLDKKLIDAHNAVKAELKTLENWGEECTCDITDYTELVEYYRGEDYPTVQRYCLDCGGFITP